MPTIRSAFQSLPILAALLAAGWLPVGNPAVAQSQLPSFAEVAGHDFGDRITVHHQMVRYLEEIADASPRVSLLEQGESWEGRRLLAAVVTSGENHGRLDAIRETGRRLSDARTLEPDEAGGLIADQPAVVWFGGSIHGFELSGAEGLLKLLERLATRDDPATREVLENAVVLIDPMLNPDGRNAFARVNRENRGRAMNPERDDWSNDFTPWQGIKYRTGHYYFDTNRDWFAHTQRETRHRLRTFREWRPQVIVDAHEMGADAEFYFDPPADPVGPYFPELATRWFERFGQAYAAAFDSAGFEYMTGERYNYFYPGYTTSYGSYQGAVGMLFEQGSSRGLALTRADESIRTLADALEQQYVAAWSAARLAARERESLLRDYHEASREAIADGREGVRRYLITPEGDPNLVAEAANLLRRNGVEVGVLAEEARLGGLRDRTGQPVDDRAFPAGTYVVEASQPRNRLLRALLEPDTPLPEDFLADARERVDRDESAEFYDITAWSVPLLFDLSAYSSTDGGSLPADSVTSRVRAGAEIPAERAAYAYVFDGSQAAAMGALYHLRERDYRAAVLLAPSRVAGTDLGSGSVIVRVGQNPESVHETVRELAERYRLDLTVLDTGLGEPGRPSLGSGDAVPVRKPEIAILAGMPVHAYSFGWAWYTLDRQYEIPVTVLRTPSAAGTSLDRFDVVVMPHVFSADAMAERLGEAGRERLERWVRDGGTLVTIGSAVDVAREDLDLLSLRSWYEEEAARTAAGAARGAGEEGGGRDDEEPEGEAPEVEDGGPEPYRFRVPGAFVRATVEESRWLSAGSGDELPVLVSSSRLYLPPEGPPDGAHRTVARYAGAAAGAAGALRMGGHLWPENEARLPGAVFVYEEEVGSGRVIAFAEDPNFRGYWRGANRLFLNAVVLGPSAP